LHIKFFQHRLATLLEKCKISVQDKRIKTGAIPRGNPAVTPFAADESASGLQTFETNILPVRTQNTIDFHCQQCGRCCRHVKDSVMVTPLDAFRLVKFFKGKGRQYTDILELYTQF